MKDRVEPVAEDGLVATHGEPVGQPPGETVP